VLYQLSYTPSTDHFDATGAAMQERRRGRDPNSRSSPMLLDRFSSNREGAKSSPISGAQLRF
jgi:hypothetical protein